MTICASGENHCYSPRLNLGLTGESVRCDECQGFLHRTCGRPCRGKILCYYCWTVTWTVEQQQGHEEQEDTTEQNPAIIPPTAPPTELEVVAAAVDNYKQQSKKRSLEAAELSKSKKKQKGSDEEDEDEYEESDEDDDNDYPDEKQIKEEPEEEDEEEDDDEEEKMAPASGQRQIRRRRRYTNQEKLELIAKCEVEGVTVAEIARQENIAEGTLRGFMKDKDSIVHATFNVRRSSQRANPSDVYSKITDHVLAFVKANAALSKNFQIKITANVLSECAKKYVDQMLQQYDDNPSGCVLNEKEVRAFKNFRASKSWARKWARAHDVHNIDSTFAHAPTIMPTSPTPPPRRPGPGKKKKEIKEDEKVGTKAAKAAKKEKQHLALQVKKLRDIISEYSPENVYTMEETTLFYKLLPHREYTSTSNGTAKDAPKGLLNAKERLTLYLCTNGTGSHKLPLTVIGKEKNPKCLLQHQGLEIENKKAVGGSINNTHCPYISQKYAWSDTKTIQDWFYRIFLPRITGIAKKKRKKVLLLLHPNCGAHVSISSGEDECAFQGTVLNDPENFVRAEILPNDYLAVANQQEVTRQDADATEVNESSPKSILEKVMMTLKIQYRHKMLMELLKVFEERQDRRNAADSASVPAHVRGILQGSMFNLQDALRLLSQVWTYNTTTNSIPIPANMIVKGWKRANIVHAYIEAEVHKIAAGGAANSSEEQKAKQEEEEREEKEEEEMSNTLMLEILTRGITSLKQSSSFSRKQRAGTLDELEESMRKLSKLSNEINLAGILKKWTLVENVEEVTAHMNTEVQCAIDHEMNRQLGRVSTNKQDPNFDAIEDADNNSKAGEKENEEEAEDDDDDNIGGGDIDLKDLSCKLMAIREHLRIEGGKEYSKVIGLLDDTTELLYQTKRELEMERLQARINTLRYSLIQQV